MRSTWLNKTNNYSSIYHANLSNAIHWGINFHESSCLKLVLSFTDDSGNFVVNCFYKYIKYETKIYALKLIVLEILAWRKPHVRRHLLRLRFVHTFPIFIAIYQYRSSISMVLHDRVIKQFRCGSHWMALLYLSRMPISIDQHKLLHFSHWIHHVSHRFNNLSPNVWKGRSRKYVIHYRFCLHFSFADMEVSQDLFWVRKKCKRMLRARCLLCVYGCIFWIRRVDVPGRNVCTCLSYLRYGFYDSWGYNILFWRHLFHSFWVFLELSLFQRDKRQ